MRRVRGVLFATVVAGCSGAPDSAPNAAIAATTTTPEGRLAADGVVDEKPVERPSIAGNANAAPRGQPTDSCEEACSFFEQCGPQFSGMLAQEIAGCRERCAREDKAWTAHYAGCVKQLGCAATAESMGMGMGPLGLCMRGP